MALWSVSSSVLLLSLGTMTVESTNDPLNEVQRIVQQLLAGSHLDVLLDLTSKAFILNSFRSSLYSINTP